MTIGQLRHDIGRLHGKLDRRRRVARIHREARRAGERLRTDQRTRRSAVDGASIGRACRRIVAAQPRKVAVEQCAARQHGTVLRQARGFGQQRRGAIEIAERHVRAGQRLQYGDTSLSIDVSLRTGLRQRRQRLVELTERLACFTELQQLVRPSRADAVPSRRSALSRRRRSAPLRNARPNGSVGDAASVANTGNQSVRSGRQTGLPRHGETADALAVTARGARFAEHRARIQIVGRQRGDLAVEVRVGRVDDDGVLGHHFAVPATYTNASVVSSMTPPAPPATAARARIRLVSITTMSLFMLTNTLPPSPPVSLASTPLD